jgi:hypothetical protein
MCVPFRIVWVFTSCLPYRLPMQPVTEPIIRTYSFRLPSLPVEALVGTLRAARKQGKVKYDGEMLFQGVHDEVIIYIVS